MNVTRILYLLIVFAVSSTLVLAVDFRADPTFVSPLAAGDIVHELIVLPDGDVMVAGEKDLPGINTGAFVMRLNPNGTIDSSFTLSPSINGGFPQFAKITVLQQLTNGQFFIAGNFYVDSTIAYYARINSDGSLDTSLPPSTVSPAIAVQPDGKLIACRDQHVVNGESYPVVHRLNSNGTFDPSFRVTWANGGFCREVKFVGDGKILVVGNFSNGGSPLKQIQRLNGDGTLDGTFNAAVNPGSGVDGLAVLPDGKLMIRNNVTSMRLLPDGGLDMVIENCTGGFLAPDGENYLMSTCKKWSFGPEFALLRVSPTGVKDGTQDQITFGALGGVRNAGPNTFYVFGIFSGYRDVVSNRILRIIPETTPPKAAFDFDGDGRSDLAVYRPSTGVWYLNRSTAGFEYVQWGSPNDKVAAGDANRDGKTDIGIFRNGAWHAYLSSLGQHLYACLGAAGDKPIVINQYRGESVAGDVFAVRGGSSLRWLVSGTTYGNCWAMPSQSTLVALTGETATDLAVAGDFNGDSSPEIGYFRNGFWYTADSDRLQAPASFTWGVAGDIPVPGDYDGDRQADYAIYRPSTGDWWINRTTAGVIVVRFGISSDLPVPADYDGDGKMDIAIYRDGSWWQYLSATGSVTVHQWGLAGDIPIPAQNQ